MNARALSALVVAASLLASVPAHAVSVRLPWEKRPAPEREHERVPPPPPANTHRDPYGNRGPAHHPHAPWNAETEFLQRMSDNVSDQIALAELALDRTGDRDVRAFAHRTLDEAGAFRESLERRAHEIGFRLDRWKNGAGWLAERSEAARRASPKGERAMDGLRGYELDLAFLRAEMDVVKRDRPYFAEYKSSVGGGFHDALQRHWDDMVYRRDDAKALHDEIRSRARRHGADA